MTQFDAPCLDLPADLLAAEQDMLQAALAAVGSGDGQRWAASLRFEGLRLLPVAARQVLLGVEWQPGGRRGKPEPFQGHERN